MTEWQVKVGGNVEPNLIDVAVTERESPYPDSATAFITDVDGTRRDEYQRGTLVEFQNREFDSGNSFSTELTTIAVNPRERDEAASNLLEVECHDVDALVRGNDTKRDISGQSLTSALEEIVTDFTPVSWNSSKVDAVDDVQITRSFRNERTDNVFQIFSQMSGGEVWGVDSNFDFFFRPAENATLSNALGSGDIFSYDLPERGEASINEARVYYDGGNKVVTVDDSEDKQQLQDQLGTPDPVTLSQPIMLENVTDRANAREQGTKKLTERSPVLVGTASTIAYSWLLDASPGDTVDLTIQDAGFSAEVRIASLQYRWSEDRVDITFVETSEQQKGYEDDFQVQIQDTLKRVEMRPATRAEENDDVDDQARVIETEVRGTLELQGDVDFDTPVDTSTITNDGFAQLRDGWIQQGVWGVDEIAVGTGTSDASRTDTALDNESESVAVSVTTSGFNAVTFTNASDFTTTDSVTEIGLKDTSTGELLARATLAEPVDSPTDGSIGITVLDDADTENTVLTETGQETARDILADNSPSYSDQYAVGSGTTSVDTTDTALATEEDSRDLGNQIIASASDASTWDDLQDVPDTQPVYVSDSGDLALAQTSFTQDAPDINDFGSPTISDTSYNDGEAVNFTASATDNLTFEIDLNYEVPAGNLQLAIRGEENASNGDYLLQCRLYTDSGIEEQTFNPTTTLDWSGFSFDSSVGPGTYTVQVLGAESFGASTTDYNIDLINVSDARIHTIGNFDNTLNSSGGYLDGPANGPTGGRRGRLSDAALQRDVGSATIDSTWTDTSGGQYLQVEGQQATNTSSTTESFSATNTLSHEVGLSAYGSRSGATPLENHQLQAVEQYTLSAGTRGMEPDGPAAVVIESDIPADVVNGVTLSESGTKAQSGDLQTRCRFAGVTIEAGETVLNRETLRFAPETRDVNDSDFDPAIVASSEQSTTGTNVQVRINSVGDQ